MTLPRIKPGSGDELLLSEMTDEELFGEWNYWNRRLPRLFFTNSGTYDHAAAMLKEIDAEMARRGWEQVEDEDRLSLSYVIG